MTIQLDTSVSPYHDDYNETKDFYKILFRPGVAVQTRELNQLQTILQKQIERFGDNVLKSGTIVRGCDIAFHDNLSYVKIRDAQTNSQPVDVSQYKNYRVRNQNDQIALNAAIIEVSDGYESQAPDLNTLFVRYLNTGYSTGGPAEGYSQFTAGETLTIYNPANVVESVSVTNPSSGFTASDRVVFTSAIAIQNTVLGTAFANNFFVGDIITDGVARAQIAETPDTTSIPGSVVLKIKPLAADLQTLDVSAWTFAANSTIRTANSSPSDFAVVTEVLGSGAQATLNVSALGQINSIDIVAKGQDYTVPPFVSIASASATTSQINLFSAIARNDLATVTVAPLATSPVGKSYAMSVSDGIIYQKGYFARVDEHLVIVDKYTNVPDGKVVGFETFETTVNSLEDPSLLDNATGAPNETAPGADRLKLTPSLIVLDKAEADLKDDFLYISEFSNGLPYKQNRQTVYNIIGDEIARRTHETNGNYVLNQFVLNTKAANTLAIDSTSFTTVVDPGTAYINGKRVVTEFNYETTVPKGIDTVTGTINLSLNYGNYVVVKELAGTFGIDTGATVTLYSTSGNFLSNHVQTIASGGLGSILGTARVRSLMHESGVVGSPSATYRLYLFDIRLNPGANFQSVRSFYADNGTQRGICDAVTENGKAVLKDPQQSSLIFYAGEKAVKSANNISYVYRTVDTSLTMSSNGTITIAAGTGERFAYTGTLTTTQERNVIVTPLANAVSSSTLSGQVSVNSGSKLLSGSSTLFTSQLQPGDFIAFDSQTNQIDYIANNTVAYLISDAAATASNLNYSLFFPKDVPISFERTSRTMATTAPDYNQLTINLGTGLSASVPVSVAYNMRSNPDAAVVTKTVNRNRFIRICTANNVATSVGPWPLGVTDVIRLNGVYKGSNSTFGVVGSENVTNNFYIDHNQTEDYLGTSYLCVNPKAPISVSNSDWLLVSFDYLTTSSEGIKKPGSGSYPINDTVALGSAVNTMHTLEVPEVYSSKGNHYDLRDSFDFRPQGNNTVVPSTTESGAPLNPTEATVVVTSALKRFPAPDSDLTASIDYYQGRFDRVIVDSTNDIRVLTGVVGSSTPPAQPEGSLTIGVLNIPPYPSLPAKLSQELVDYIDTGVFNVRYSNQRSNQFTILGVTSDSARNVFQPKTYSMEQIGKLEKRITDLEYYVSLTMVEQMAQKRSIPSSTTPIDRYKFGFYVNSFEDYSFAEVTDSGYNASIVDGYLMPGVREINLIASAVDGQVSLPYEEVTLVSQNKATAVSTTSNTTQQAQRIVSVIQHQRSTSRRKSPPWFFEEFNYTFSNLPAPVEFYFNGTDNYTEVAVYQSRTEGVFNDPPIITSTSAVPITKTDVLLKGLQVLNYGRFKHLGSIERRSNGPIFRWIEDHYKFFWIHNPDLGQYVKIRVYKGQHKGAHGVPGTYSFKMFYPVDGEVNLNTTTPTTNFYYGYGGIFLNNFLVDRR